MSSIPDTSGMTNTPEYPFRFIHTLNEQYREPALRNVENYRKQVQGAITFLVPRASKKEFLRWVSDMWDESDENWQDHLGRPES